MAMKKCDCTKKAHSRRMSKKAEASTDKAKSRTTSRKTSRISNCN